MTPSPSNKPEWGTVVAVVLSIVALIVWAVRVEGRVNSNEQTISYLRGEVSYLRGQVDRVFQPFGGTR